MDGADVTKSITILGATGSIGASTLDVIDRHPDRYSVHALTANRNTGALLELCRRYQPEIAVVADESLAAGFGRQVREAGLTTRVLCGQSGLCEAAADGGTDVVMAAIVGAAGLTPTLAGVNAGKQILLANKEALVMSGSLFMSAAREAGVSLLPIDSEHNAIFQCLANGAESHAGGVRRLMLTASGGPLLRLPMEDMVKVTPDEAVAHPNWDMGRKISVDSASMMNKGLELIEASLLFDMPPSQIDVVIHPQSIVHSMVEYVDGSVVAQLGNPDMRTPIAHALGWPDRVDSGVSSLDLIAAADLSFEPADMARFPCLRLCREVADEAQVHKIALNAANEIAVEAFLSELIPFTAIPTIIASVLEQTSSIQVLTIEDVLSADAEARARAREQLPS